MQHNQPQPTYYRFFTEAKEFPLADEANGEFRFQDVDMVQVINVGDKNYMPIHEVEHYKSLQKRMLNNGIISADDVRNFENQYKGFKEGKQGFSHEGTSLSAIPVFSKADIINLNAENIFTVEQLANVPDSAIYNLGRGFASLKQKAEVYLQEKTGANAINKVINQNEILVNQNAKNEQTIAELKEQMAQLLAMQNNNSDNNTKTKSK